MPLREKAESVPTGVQNARPKKSKPWWVTPPEHINYFDVPSVTQLLTDCGFKRHHVTSTFPLDAFLLMGDNYIGDDEVGRTTHARRKNLEFALQRAGLSPLKQRLYEVFAEYNIGRQIDITGIKLTEMRV